MKHLSSVLFSIVVAIFAADLRAQCSPPVFTTHPQSVTVNHGQMVTLSVAATNASQFDWYRSSGSGTEGLGTGSSKTFAAPVQTTDYWVWATNSCANGTAVSNTARVTVAGPIVSVNGPADTPLCPFGAADRAILYLSITGAGPRYVEWYEYVPGQPSIKLDQHGESLTMNRTGQFFAWVWNAENAMVSRLATILPAPPPIATIDRVVGPESMQLGTTATLYAEASGQADSYGWYENSNLIASASWVNVQPSSVGVKSYSFRATNACTISSKSLQIRVCNNPPVATTTQSNPQGSPRDAVIDPGQSVQLSASFQNFPTQYDWYKVVPGQAAELVQSGPASGMTVSPTSKTSYFVWAHSACGSGVSRVATVTIRGGQITITSQPQDQTITSGQSATLTVQATAPSPLQYFWYRYVPGASEAAGTGNSISVSPTTTSQYYCVIVGDDGYEGSRMVTVTVQ